MVQCSKCGYDEIQLQHKICPMCGEHIKNSVQSHPKKPEKINKCDDIEDESDNGFESQDILVSPRSNVGHIVQAKVRDSKSGDDRSKKSGFNPQDILIGPRSSVGKIYQVGEIHLHIDGGRGRSQTHYDFSEKAYLVYFDDELREQAISVESELVIKRGRDTRVEICTAEYVSPINVRDCTVSRGKVERGRDGHVHFCIEDGTLFVTDLDSKNGTFHNGVKIKPHTKHKLARGDTIRVGCHLHFRVESDPSHLTVERGDSVFMQHPETSSLNLLSTHTLKAGEYDIDGRRVFVKETERATKGGGEESGECDTKVLDKILAEGKRFIGMSETVSASDVFETILPAVEKELRDLETGKDIRGNYLDKFEELRKQYHAAGDIGDMREKMQKIVEELQGELSN